MPCARVIARLPARPPSTWRSLRWIRLRYEPSAAIDLARFATLVHQIVVDAGAHDLGGIRGDVTTLEWIRARFAEATEKVDLIRINVHLIELRNLLNDEDLSGARAEALDLLDTLERVAIAG